MQYEEAKAIEIDQDVFITEESLRRARNKRIVVENVFWSGTIGLIPIPFLDIVGITAIQVKMLNELSIEYGVKFRRNRAKALVASVSSGLGLHAISSLKLVPGVGSGTSGIGVSIAGGALTYAVGSFFIEHFEAGGTLDNVEIEKARERMKTLVEEGKTVVSKKQR